MSTDFSSGLPAPSAVTGSVPTTSSLNVSRMCEMPGASAGEYA